MKRVVPASSRWLLLFALVSVLGGCSAFSKKTGNEPVELVEFDSSIKLERVWQRQVGQGQSSGFSSLVPALDGELLYAVDHLGQLSAFEAETGKKRWSRRINKQFHGVSGWFKSLYTAKDASYEILGGVFAGKGLLLVASYAGEVIALDQASGDELWRVALSGEVMSSPQTNGSVVAVQTINGKLFALDAKTGKQLWFYESPPPNLTLRGTPAPIVLDAAIYAGFSNGRLMAFNPDNGLILWDQRIAMPKGRSELERMVDIHSSPLTDGGIVYAGSYQGRLLALSRGSGSPLWAKDASTTENLALADGKLFMVDTDGRLSAFNATNGEPLWVNEQMLRRQLTSPQVFDQYVAVVDYQGYLHVLSQDKGELVVRKRLDRPRLMSSHNPAELVKRVRKSSSGARAPMVSDGNILYVYSNNGSLEAYRVKAGR